MNFFNLFTQLKIFKVYLPQFWWKIVFQPKMIDGKIIVCRNPKLDHIFLFIEVEETHGADQSTKERQQDDFFGVRGNF